MTTFEAPACAQSKKWYVSIIEQQQLRSNLGPSISNLTDIFHDFLQFHQTVP
jgi:hypothetical protein